MKMTELSFEGRQPPVDSYAPGGFRVQGRFFEGPMLIGPEGVAPWPVAALPALDAAAADVVLAAAGDAGADLVVLGCGTDMAPPPAAFSRAIEAKGLGLEFMATATACRTYNVLLSEDRRVVAALLTV